MYKSLVTSVIVAVAALSAPVSHAVPITFNLSYSGASFGNQATGTGFVTFDDAVLPNPGTLANVTAATLGVQAFSIAIAGASTGNGTFGLGSVTNWIWSVSAPLNLTGELVGQVGFLDFNWCAANFIGCIAPAPGGISAFTISTNAETGDRLVLTSMRRATVPEPATLALLVFGLFGIAVMRRQTRR